MNSPKTVIITGASSGIGMATGKLLAQNGYNVMLAARRTDRLQGLAQSLGEKAAYCTCDVIQPASVKEMVAQTVARFGGVDVLINNAGLGQMAPIEDANLEEWHRMVDVNVKGLLSCIHAAMPYLLASKGQIINLSSVAAHGVFPNAVVYCATKHAVTAITQGLRLELRGRVRVTDISPGAVATEFLDQTTHQETARKYKEASTPEVVLHPEEIAQAILEVVQKPWHIVISEVIIRPNV